MSVTVMGRLRSATPPSEDDEDTGPAPYQNFDDSRIDDRAVFKSDPFKIARMNAKSSAAWTMLEPPKVPKRSRLEVANEQLMLEAKEKGKKGKEVMEYNKTKKYTKKQWQRGRDGWKDMVDRPFLEEEPAAAPKKKKKIGILEQLEIEEEKERKKKEKKEKAAKTRKDKAKAKKKAAEEKIEFKSIPKNAESNSEFPIIAGLEKQRSLPAKSRGKVIGNLFPKNATKEKINVDELLGSKSSASPTLFEADVRPPSKLAKTVDTNVSKYFTPATDNTVSHRKRSAPSDSPVDYKIVSPASPSARHASPPAPRILPQRCATEEDGIYRPQPKRFKDVRSMKNLMALEDVVYTVLPRKDISRSNDREIPQTMRKLHQLPPTRKVAPLPKIRQDYPISSANRSVNLPDAYNHPSFDAPAQSEPWSTLPTKKSRSNGSKLPDKFHFTSARIFDHPPPPPTHSRAVEPKSRLSLFRPNLPPVPIADATHPHSDPYANPHHVPASHSASTSRSHNLKIKTGTAQGRMYGSETIRSTPFDPYRRIPEDAFNPQYSQGEPRNGNDTYQEAEKDWSQAWKISNQRTARQNYQAQQDSQDYNDSSNYRDSASEFKFAKQSVY